MLCRYMRPYNGWIVQVTNRLKPGLLLVAISYLAFISLGLPDGLLGTAWPSIRSDFGLPVDAIGSLFVSSTAGYLLASALSGWLLSHMRVGTLLALSCLATSLSLGGYGLSGAWGFVVLLGFVLGCGGGAIDAGLNAYAATNFDARTVNWLHASFGLGATIGPALMALVLGAALSWRVGYLVVSGAQLLLALLFFASRALWAGPTNEIAAGVRKAPMVATLRLPASWLGFVLFLVYSGLEMSAGQWAYSLLVEARGLDKTLAGFWVSLYWGGLTIGRVVFGLLAGFMPVSQLLRLCMIGVIGSTALIWFGGASVLSLAGLMLMGFLLAPMFPSLIAETPGRLGEEHTANAVGLQVSSAGIGLAALPALTGLIARYNGLEAIGPTLAVMSVVLFVLHEITLRGD
jgi:fucose permease